VTCSGDHMYFALALAPPGVVASCGISLDMPSALRFAGRHDDPPRGVACLRDTGREEISEYTFGYVRPQNPPTYDSPPRA
jgi:hypothetical protein